jgi:hypothetical protein
LLSRFDKRWGKTTCGRGLARDCGVSGDMQSD